MTTGTAPQTPSPTRRRRHWLRWTLVGVAGLIVVIVAGAVLAVALQKSPAPLALPSAVGAPVGSVDGTWQVTDGSVAGFRIQQKVLGMTSDVVARTEHVRGTVVIAGGQITSANLTINLMDLKSGDKPVAPQFAISLDTAQHPEAIAELTRPVALGDGFTSGTVTDITASGQLTLRGVSHAVTVPVSLRRDGEQIVVAGTVPVAFVDYGLDQPKGYGGLGSLADRGVAEFLLVLRHS
jgi:polyisoprenoid-binding protein YceI